MNSKLPDFIIPLLLTAFIPMAVYLAFGDLTPSYRWFDIADFMVYALIGFLSHALIENRFGEADLDSMISGAVLGRFLYPIDTLPLLLEGLMSGPPYLGLGWLVDIVAAALGIYAYHKRDEIRERFPLFSSGVHAR